MGEKIISIEDLGKSFGDHEVLRKIDFSVEKGQTIGIIGGTGRSSVSWDPPDPENPRFCAVSTDWSIRQAEKSFITERT